MEINLSSVGMEKGRQYETVITTISPEGKRNAAPIGVICTGKDSIICRIFKGSTTLENIISQKEFTVNKSVGVMIHSCNIRRNLF